MILTDEVTVLTTATTLTGGAVMTDEQISNAVTVPASVAYKSTGDDQGDDARSYFQEQSLLVQIEPLNADLDPLHNNVEWRGKRYGIEGSPLIRRRHGADHHWTIQLVRATG